jgi:hypothetical protein
VDKVNNKIASFAGFASLARNLSPKRLLSICVAHDIRCQFRVERTQPWLAARASDTLASRINVREKIARRG